MKLEKNLILGTGENRDFDELFTDYNDYVKDLNMMLEQTPKVYLGFSSRDYDFLNKYKIDITTHLENLFRMDNYLKRSDEK